MNNRIKATDEAIAEMWERVDAAAKASGFRQAKGLFPDLRQYVSTEEAERYGDLKVQVTVKTAGGFLRDEWVDRVVVKTDGLYSYNTGVREYVRSIEASKATHTVLAGAMQNARLRLSARATELREQHAQQAKARKNCDATAARMRELGFPLGGSDGPGRHEGNAYETRFGTVSINLSGQHRIAIAIPSITPEHALELLVMMGAEPVVPTP